MEELRPLLTTYAYNILGSYEEAKDVVQDAFLKFMDIDSDKIEDKRNYLIRTVVNLSINAKKRQQKIVAAYTGPWLPEPVATEKADAAIVQKEVLSYSLMVLLEKLNARQRAVFILKEAFDYDHEEIAGVLDISVENSRKLLSRAKVQLQKGTPVSRQPQPVQTGYIDKYLSAIREGDTRQLEQMLHDEVVLLSDGGGKAVAATKPLMGIKSVISFLVGVFTKSYKETRIEQGEVNHEPALFYYHNGQLVTCQIFSIRDGQVENFYFMRNPDKLKELQK
ncbi:sigma-70 family RNA polymerase sigma factor [Pseudoflavitalea sp. X16]|uniref:sigma-70 family RNA polymerase sigma factor n=1 Tax=Paraflavitalea devenefica TaxID=2716334 RepID=UPI0014231814|nr:sigma-70 family RNA polymerase sigma factor [Paraflavitalea devenefica]NII27167.1 sigma-70 family RNA polymerase sigma factor [Paraflavitalea devenefica]